MPIIKIPRSITWSIVLSDIAKAFPQRKHDAKPAYYPMTSGSKKNVKFSLVICLDMAEAIKAIEGIFRGKKGGPR